MIRMVFFLHALFVFIFFTEGLFSAPLPRNVIALYDSKADENAWFSQVLQYAAMPIEQQGLVVTYHDVQEGFPDIYNDSTVIGAVVWDLGSLDKDQSQEYLDWAIKSLEAKKKLVFLGTLPGVEMSPGSIYATKMSRFWQLMGLSSDDTFQSDSFGVQFICNQPFICNFERDIRGRLPGYPRVNVVGEKHTVFLMAKEPRGRESVLIVTTPSGGYAANGFALYRAYYNERYYVQWYINPFIFFKEAFDTKSYPKPDVTTLAGRRMYYSHIDGDGWNSVSLVGNYRVNKEISAKVILEKVIAPHSNLPVTVAPVAADLDPDWVGLPQSQEVAIDLFTLEHVELGSHTYSHPFDWGFFKNYQASDEKPYLEKYPFRTWNDDSLFDEVVEFFDEEDGERQDKLEREFHYPKELDKGYSIPRAFANEKFDIKKEIGGSAKFINTFSKSDKKVAVVQWSGDCLPFEEALELVVSSHLKNINGGDTRFDAEYDSYAWVKPLGRNVGNWLQVFSSMSNENLYTDLWTKRFYGFNQLPKTFYNTESPIRLRPMNLYYHMYSGEKLASLQALLQNIEYIEEQEIHPVETSRYTDIVDGYYRTDLIPFGEKRWLVAKRGELQTIRFDEAVFSAVDFEKSVGVIGQRHLQGSLYVALDESVKEPLIVLRDNDTFYKEPTADFPYLIESRWHVWNLFRSGDLSWSFDAKGYGDGEMSWRVPENGEYSVYVNGHEKLKVGTSNGVLKFVLKESGIEPLKVSILREGNE